MVTYLDYLKDELKYRSFIYLFLVPALALGCYLNKENIYSPLRIFFIVCVLVIGGLVVNSYARYKERTISISRSVTMTYLDYLKHQIKYGYLRSLILSVLTGLVLFFINASYLMIFLYSGGLFSVGLMLDAYAKTTYRKF